MFYTYEEETIEYNVKASNRQSIELRIDPTGIVYLKVPRGTNDKTIFHALETKWSWILKSLSKVSTEQSMFEKRLYVTGESFNILGEVCLITVHRHHHEKMNVKRINNEIIISIPQNVTLLECHELMEHYFKAVLKKYLHSRMAYFEEHVNIKVNKISVRNQKTRWGSCSSGRNISFNYRLALAPLEVIDYIIVHEMCHLEHMNHSKSFWKKVYDVMPEYEKHENWLKYYGRTLSVEWMVKDD